VTRLERRDTPNEPGGAVNTKTAVVVAAAILTAACGGGTTPPPAGPSSTAPTLEQQLLATAHAEQWPATDADLIQRAHLQCPEPGHVATSTDLAVNFLILDTKFTQQQARSLVYPSLGLFWPAAVGR